ncbi:MAG: glycosyltransferase family 9 protein [Oligoflexia bacterium]|nr:glycosyltransferase family 9 protein [Oligoflexia bacterium]
MQYEKIIVRLPNWLGDIVMSFQFLDCVIDKFSNAKIYFIVRSIYAEILRIIPAVATGRVKLVPYEHSSGGPLIEKIASLIKFKRLNQDLLFAEVYFSMPPSFSAALMGKTLRAKKVIGFRGNFCTVILTQALVRPLKVHRSREFLTLLSEINDRTIKLDVSGIGNQEYLDLMPYVVININSDGISRRMPLQQWIKIFLKLYQRSSEVGGSVHRYKFIFTGLQSDHEKIEELIKSIIKSIVIRERDNEGERSLSPFLNFSGQTSVVQLMTLLRYASLLVSNDSGPAHLAALLKTPVIVFFGAGDVTNTGPVSETTYVFRSSETVCSPCYKNACKYSRDDSRHLDCLNNIKLDNVVDKMVDLMA